MLSLRQCLENLDTTLDDESLRRLVANLYGMAPAVIDLALQSPPMTPKSEDSPGPGNMPSGPEAESAFEKATRPLTADQEEEVVERAAIMEYDAGRQRDEAERYALGRFLKESREP